MKKRTITFVSILALLFMAGCKYDFTIPVTVPPVTGTVSFASQVAPIFSAGSKCTACHSAAGGQTPYLTATEAFASLVPAMVNTSAPDQSRILTFPGPTTSTHSWKKLSASEAAIILAWIQAGAKNN